MATVCDHVCPTCGESFASEQLLHKHCRDEGASHAFCDQCKRPFKDKKRLREHRVKNAESHSYCVKCRRAFADRSYLYQHYDTAPRHQKVGDSKRESVQAPDLCELCKPHLGFTSQVKQTQHLRMKHNWCFICSCEFPSKQALEQHNKSIAHSPRDIKCPDCPALFKAYSSLKQHFKTRRGCYRDA